MSMSARRGVLPTIIATALVLSGCSLLPGYGWTSYSPGGPQASRGPQVTYTSDSATLTLNGGDGLTVELPLRSGGRDPMGIGWASYRDGNRWAVQLADYGSIQGPPAADSHMSWTALGRCHRHEQLQWRSRRPRSAWLRRRPAMDPDTPQLMGSSTNLP